jgi:hypothetical protein
MQERIAGCLCGEFRIEHVDHQAHTKSTGVPERWLIRNSR